VLEAVDVVCVEATFRVTASGVPETWTCGLYRDDSLVVTETLSGQSGYIRDTGLLPAADYTYHITYMKDGRDKDRSDPVAVTTLDTTSHDFTWTVETLGDAGSYLNDVAIVDENNIWVVGYIKEGDSIYNAAHWDGEKWEMIRVMSGHTAVTGISYFSRDDIWVTLGIVAHWNGNEWVLYHLWDMGIIHYPEDGGVYQVWGSSSDNVWFAGDNGTLVHYDGSRFRRVESGIDERLTDIYGLHSDLFWICGVDGWTDGTIFLEYEKGVIRELTPESNMEYSPYYSSIWMNNPYRIYIASYSGYWIYDRLENKVTLQETESVWVGNTIRGNAANDVIAAGQGGEILHYNGMNWHLYTEIPEKVILPGSIWWMGLDIRNDFIVISGIVSTYITNSLIAIGRRS
jgi:hypothetical protein